jgi:hypothetical protein
MESDTLFLLDGLELLLLTVLLVTLTYYGVMMARSFRLGVESGPRWLGPATLGIYYLLNSALYDETGRSYRRKLLLGLAILAAPASVHLADLPWLLGF